MKLIKSIFLMCFTASLICGNAFAQEDNDSAELGDVFGTKGGYVHPFASLAYASSDNIYYAEDDPTGDTITTLSIGIWFALPASRDQILNLETSNYAPGGLEISREYKPYVDRYQLYFLYSGTDERYSDEDENNVQKHKAEAFGQYNLKGGLTFELVGQHNKSAEAKEISKDSTLDNTYTANLIGFLALYHFSETTRIELEASNFSVNYDENENEAKNRTDSSAALAFYLGLTEKTKVFAGYETIDVKYEEDTIDNKQNQMFVGFSWQATEKSKGKIKVGQATKTFEEDDTYDDANSSFVELTANHEFTPKTSLTASGSRRMRETTTSVSSYYYIQNQNLLLAYKQNITEKLSLRVNYDYSFDVYNALTGDDREDTITTPELTVGYGFTDWLSAEVGFSSTKIESTIDTYDATNNTGYIRVTGYL
ncbi:MAG: hypothetical protein MJE63_00920 [Proteobacteria bacterium]|nr:hypothetical protein [Pseudomonadota bacterium]